MAFDQRNFAPVGAHSADTPNLFSYKTDDNLFLVTSQDYFTKKSSQLKEGDFMIIQAADGSGMYEVDSTKSGVEPVAQEHTVTAFGELSTSQLTPIFQYDFSYNINNRLFLQKNNYGTVSIDSNRLKLSTGAGANQSARIESVIPIKYRAGQGGLCRLTALFTEGVAGSMQLAGIGDEANGLFFGYNGTEFGIARRYGGSKHVQELQITTSSTTAENITITLDGETTGNIAVTNSGNATITANEIVAYADWATLDGGWEAHADGDTIVFSSFEAGDRAGAYAITATTAAGTFTTDVTGVTATDEWTYQEDWSEDAFDGAGSSGITLDQTKGNIYQVKYQWLGYGLISFWIENPDSGMLTNVHNIKYANSNVLPSFDSPTIPICYLAMNMANTSDLTVYSASCAGFTEGQVKRSDVHFATSNTMAVSLTEVPIVTVHNKAIFSGKVNRNRIRFSFMSVSADTNKETTFKFYAGGVLVNASFSDIVSNSSVAAIDTSATSITGGEMQFVSSGAVFDLNNASFYIYPGQSLTVTQLGVSGSSGNVTASLNWEEEI